MWSVLLFVTASFAAEVHDFPSSMRELSLGVSAGNVTVRTGGDRVHVVGEWRSEPGLCRLAFDDEAGQVLLKASGSSTNGCEMDFEVTLPEGVGLRAVVAAGDLDLDVSSAVAIEVAAGDVTGRVGGALQATVSAGDVSLRGLTQPVTVQVNAGDVALAFDRAPQGKVSVNVAAGDIEVDLPDDTAVNGRFPRGAKISLAQKTTAATVLAVRCAVGQVVIQ